MSYQKDLRDFAKGFERELEKALNNRFFIKIGQLVSQVIYRRTVSGYGITSHEGEKVSLKKLSPEYVKQRERIYSGVKQALKGRSAKVKRRTNRFLGLGDYFSPKKSNLTFTGQMLKAIDYKATAYGVSLFIKNDQRKGSHLTNARVAGYVSESRQFFGLTHDELEIVQREVENAIRIVARKLS